MGAGGEAGRVGGAYGDGILVELSGNSESRRTRQDSEVELDSETLPYNSCGLSQR